MQRQAVSLGMMAQAVDPLTVEAFCGECGAPLGSYFGGRDLNTGNFCLTPHEAPRGRKRVAPVLRGQRTQPGLYEETYDGRIYLRKKCPCGSNDKRAMAKVAELPVTIREDGTVVLVF